MTHPSTESLESYLFGRLTDEEVAELEAHLEQCPACLAKYDQLERRWPLPALLLSDDPLAPGMAGVAAGDSEGGPRVLPFRLGDYECFQELGRGGMGVVYCATDTRLRREVAIKLIVPRRDLAGDSVERFQHEAKAASELEHANIVEVKQFGEHDGELYIVMPYLRGGNLDGCLRERKRLPPVEAAEIVKTLAGAVEFAHRRGIVHRDLKPGNILFTADTPPVPKIADFGLAKRLDGSGPQTGLGFRAGTPGYMSPEQDLGVSDQVGPWSDIYALGAILHTCLVGKPPLLGETRDEIMVRLLSTSHVSGQSPAGSTPAGPTTARRGVARDLAAICLACLAKDPQQRYASAAELARDLERFIAGVPVSVRRATWWERSWRSCQRNRLATTLIGLLVVGFAASFLAVAVALKQQEQALQGEKLQRERAQRARDEAERAAYDERLLFVQDVADRNPNLASKLLLDAERCPTKLRDFSWSLLYSRSQLESDRWRNEDEAGCVDCSPTDARFVTGHADGAVRLRRQDDRSFLQELGVSQQEALNGGRAHEDAVTGVAFSPDGRWLATCSRDGTTKLWDSQRDDPGLPIRILRPNDSADKVRTCGLAFSPDGKYLATAHADAVVRIWDLDVVWHEELERSELSKACSELQGHQASVSQVAFTSDGAYLISGSRDATVRVWTKETKEKEGWKQLAVLSEDMRPVLSVATHPGRAELFATGGEIDHAVKLWTIRDGTVGLLRRIPHVDAHISGLAFHGDLLAIVGESAGGQDGTLQPVHFDQTCDRPRVLARGSKGIKSVAFTREGDVLISDGAGDVQRLRRQTHDNPTVIELFNASLTGLCFAPDGSTLDGDITGKEGYALSRWNVADGKHLLQRRTGFPAGIRGSVANAKATHRVWYSDQGIHVPDYYPFPNAAQQPLNFSPLDRLAGIPYAVCVSASGEYVLLCDENGLRCWSLQDKQPKWTEWSDAELHGVVLMAATGSEPTVLVSDTDRVWEIDLRTKEVSSFETPPELQIASGGISALAVSTDGRMMAMAYVGLDRQSNIYLRDRTETGNPGRLAKGHSDVVQCLAFSPDSQTLASGDQEGDVRLWDGQLGLLRLTLQGSPSAPADFLFFSPDGQRLVAASRAGHIRVWHGVRP